MSSVVDSILVAVFLVGTSALALYGLHFYVLVFLFRRRHRAMRQAQREYVERYLATTPDEEWLGVTTQIPIYNEADVATRVIQAAAAMDYPRGKHRIQVLDDSTDETRFLVDRTVRRLREQGVDIEVIRREDREGYKAGALRNGLRHSPHPLVAIFDADFVPPVDFLRRATPLLARNERIACVQTRWGHLNVNESWLTRPQAVGLDGHFALEQGTRAWNGLMMNFNGTAGIWRKAAIEDPAVGGWSADTLTEDLDLSYRAQLAGWKMEFCLDIVCPAELPNTINAFKAQQRRWATGSMQTAVKLLPRIWRSPLSLGEKLEATIHLTHHSAALWMVFLVLLARPMLVMVDPVPYFWCFFSGWTMILLGSLAPPVAYGYARHVLGMGSWSGIRTVPALILLGTGISISNAAAVLRGLFTRGGEFVRTPKSGSTPSARQQSRYKPKRYQHLWFIEMLVGAYAAANWAIYMSTGRFAFSIFLMIYAASFLTIGWISRPEATSRRRLVWVEDPEPAPTGAGPLAPVPTAVHAG